MQTTRRASNSAFKTSAPLIGFGSGSGARSSGYWSENEMFKMKQSALHMDSGPVQRATGFPAKNKGLPKWSLAFEPRS